jgi:hypothetical protein
MDGVGDGRVRAGGWAQPGSIAESSGRPGEGAVRAGEALNLATAHAFCRGVREHLAAGTGRLSLDLGAVTRIDAVGLAALLQSVRLSALMGLAVSVVPSAAVYWAFVDAEILEELPVGSVMALEGPVRPAPGDWPAAPTPLLASTSRVKLRQPGWDELALFETWARNPFLDQMVGSDLLYRCRHLGPYHPEVVSAILNDATSLTLVVEPVGVPWNPVGFVRLHHIRLIEQLAFLETAIADPRFLKKGWGIEASRLLVAYAMDALEIRRVESKAYEYNVLSINSLKRNGFVQEGVLREAKSCDGQRWDIVVFSLLKDEMEAQRSREPFPYMGLWR